MSENEPIDVIDKIPDPETIRKEICRLDRKKAALKKLLKISESLEEAK